jgi:hypothetical protein
LYSQHEASEDFHPESSSPASMKSQLSVASSMAALRSLHDNAQLDHHLQSQSRSVRHTKAPLETLHCPQHSSFAHHAPELVPILTTKKSTHVRSTRSAHSPTVKSEAFAPSGHVRHKNSKLQPKSCHIAVQTVQTVPPEPAKPSSLCIRCQSLLGPAGHRRSVSRYLPLVYIS